MPPPTTTTSYCLIFMRFAPSLNGVGATPSFIIYAIAVREWRHPVDSRSEPVLGLTFAFFLELQHGCARGDFDFAVDDGALGDGDGSGADLAAYHRGIADLQF